MIQVGDICSARKKLGLSQEQLAEVLGVSRNTIGRWERGECAPNADKMAKLDRMLAQLEAPAVSADTPAPEDTPPKEAGAPPPVVPTKAKRWPAALICAGVVCALLIGIASLIGVYSINRRLNLTDDTAPIEEVEIEREEVDQFQINAPVTLQPLQP